MRNVFLSGLCLFIISLFLQFPVFGQSDPLRAEIEKIIRYDTEIDFEKTPGFILGIIDSDSSYVLSFGSDSPGSSTQISANTVFEIGSVSKVMTASLVAILTSRDLLSYNSRVNDLLPEAYRNPELNDLDIEDLLTHQSGFPKLPRNFGTLQDEIRDPYAHYTKKDLLEFYKSFLPQKKTGMLYSHVNFALLEIALEHTFNLSFEQLMQKYLWNPYGMDSSVIHKKIKVIQGYDRAGNRASPWTFASFAASEGVKSTMNNLIKFVRLHLNPDTNVKKAIKKGHEIHSPTPYNKNLFVGHGWHIVQHKKQYPIISHSGSTSGHHAFVAFVVETQTAVIILCNSSIGVEDLGLLVLRMINYNWKRK